MDLETIILRIKLSLTQFFLFAFFILLATVPSFVTIEGKNYLFIVFSFVGAIVLAFTESASFPKWKEPVLLIILAYIILSFLFHTNDAQILSVVYSTFFIAAFLFYSSFMRDKLNKVDYVKILKATFILYFLGTIAGQTLVYLNLFSAVSVTGTSVHGIMGTLLEPTGFRYYSFSSEPSYAAFIIVILYYSFTSLSAEDFFFKKENYILLFMLLYMIVMFRSAYGVILIGALAVGKIGFSLRTVLFYFLLLLVFIFLVFLDYSNPDYDFPALERVLRIARELDFSNPHSLSQIDFTSYYRIAPFIHYVESADLFDTGFYFGHGAGSSKLFIVPEIYLAYQNGEFAGGFMPAFFYEYGIIGAALVLIFIYQRISFVSISSLVVVLMLLNANMNTQLFWLVILCLTLNYDHGKQTKNEPVH